MTLPRLCLSWVRSSSASKCHCTLEQRRETATPTCRRWTGEWWCVWAAAASFTCTSSSCQCWSENQHSSYYYSLYKLLLFVFICARVCVVVFTFQFQCQWLKLLKQLRAILLHQWVQDFYCEVFVRHFLSILSVLSCWCLLFFQASFCFQYTPADEVQQKKNLLQPVCPSIIFFFFFYLTLNPDQPV